MFAYSPQKPLAGEAIAFNATASKGKIAENKWDFGDKNVTTITNSIIHHSYASPANYTVTLTVKDDQGLIDKTEKILNVTSP